MRGAAGLGQKGGVSVEQLEARLLRYHEIPSALDFDPFADLSWKQDYAVTADGREMVIGRGNAANALYVLARYVRGPNPNNVIPLDHTFGPGGTGYVLVDPANGLPGKPRALAMLPDGRMLVLGDVQAWDAVSGEWNTQITLTRHLADGTVDATFGTSGVVANDSAGRMTMFDLVVAPDGKLIAMGTIYGGDGTGSRAMLVRRFNADGTPDVTFGAGGVVAADFPGENDGAGYAHVDGQGRIVVGGETLLPGAVEPTIAILRLMSNGAPDTTFGTNGQWIGNLTVEMPGAATDGYFENYFGSEPTVNQLTRLFVGEAAGPTKMINGVLFVAGTSGPDDIRISRTETSIDVRMNGVTYQHPLNQLGGPIYIDALAGDDLIEVNVELPPAWVWGGEGDDRIAGSNWNDHLFGGPGNDRLDGRGGDDTMHGGGGTDAIVGNEGRDWITGGYGNDRVASGPGTDFVYGGYGNDLIGGGSSSDYLYGGAGNDTLNGNGGGTDYVAGNEGTNVYAGQANVSAAAHVARASLFADLTRNDDDDEPEVLQSLW